MTGAGNATATENLKRALGERALFRFSATLVIQPASDPLQTAGPRSVTGLPGPVCKACGEVRAPVCPGPRAVAARPRAVTARPRAVTARPRAIATCPRAVTARPRAIAASQAEHASRLVVVRVTFKMLCARQIGLNVQARIGRKSTRLNS